MFLVGGGIALASLTFGLRMLWRASCVNRGLQEDAEKVKVVGTGMAKAQRPRKVKAGYKWARYGQLPAVGEHEIGAENGALGASAADWDETLPEIKLARPKGACMKWDADGSESKETTGWHVDVSSELKDWDYDVERSCQLLSSDTAEWDINLVPSPELDEDDGEDLTARASVRISL